MPTKNYYLILGVSRHESAAGIQDAFRELAKRYHPDVAGPEGRDHFRDLLEAYKHLSDLQLRARYNHSLRGAEEKEGAKAEPIAAGQSKRPKPLVPEPVSILRSFQTVRPSFDEMFDRFLRNFTGIGLPKGERIEDLNLEMILSPSEAAEGGLVRIGVPFFHPCPLCGGSGRDWLFPCSYCREQGMIEEQQTIGVSIPPMVRERTILEVPIRGLGIHNFHLRLHIRIVP